jgi:hypothetical protein
MTHDTQQGHKKMTEPNPHLEGHQKMKKKQQPGPKKGSTRTEIPKSVWHQLCKDYIDNHQNVKQKVYLATQKISDKIKDTPSNIVSFSGYLKKFKANELQPSDLRRIRERKFQLIEDKLIEYLDLHGRHNPRDKCDTSWLILGKKCQQWASDAGFEDFKASAGWISGVLKRHSKVKVNLHGEASNLSPNDRIAREAQTVVGVESENESENEGGNDYDEDTAMSITTHHQAEVVIGNLISYCRRRKFNDAIGDLEKASKKIRNAHIEERANSFQS